MNAGVRCPGRSAADHGGLLGGQVGGVVRLDVADRSVQVGAAAQRPVDDEQVVFVLVLARTASASSTSTLVSRCCSASESWSNAGPFGETRRVPRGLRDDVCRVGGGGEQAALDDDVRDARGTVAGDDAGREGRGDASGRLRVTAVHPDPRVDPADSVEEEHDAGQRGRRIRVDAGCQRAAGTSRSRSELCAGVVERLRRPSRRRRPARTRDPTDRR